MRAKKNLTRNGWRQPEFGRTPICGGRKRACSVRNNDGQARSGGTGEPRQWHEWHKPCRGFATGDKAGSGTRAASCATLCSVNTSAPPHWLHLSTGKSLCREANEAKSVSVSAVRRGRKRTQCRVVDEAKRIRLRPLSGRNARTREPYASASRVATP